MGTRLRAGLMGPDGPGKVVDDFRGHRPQSVPAQSLFKLIVHGGGGIADGGLVKLVVERAQE